MYKCKYCNREFKKNSNHVSHEKYYCRKNPNWSKEEAKKRSVKGKKENIKRYGKFKFFKVKCYKCEKEFEVKEREKLFPKKEKYFCSKKCIHSRDWSKKETKIVKCNHCEKVMKVDKHKSSKFVYCRECALRRKHEKRAKRRRSFLLECSYCKKKHFQKESPSLFCYARYRRIGESLLREKWNICQEKEKIKKLKNKIEDLYFKQHYNLSNIVKEFHLSNRSFLFLFDLLNIRRKTKSEEGVSSVLSGRKNPPVYKKGIKTIINYKRGYHTSWEGSVFYYRSSYELDYAEELDKQKISYKVEPFRIAYYNSVKKRNTVALPDFYLPFSNTIVEVKSKYTYDKQEMKDRFKAYRKLGYKCILLLEHREYKKVV